MQISFANFDPRRSYLIYSTFFGFALLICLVAAYSVVERRRFVAREHLIVLGAIPRFKDKAKLKYGVSSERMEQVLEMKLIPRCLCLFKIKLCNAMVTKHAWLAVLWPTGVHVQPKRFIKVPCVLTVNFLPS